MPLPEAGPVRMGNEVSFVTKNPDWTDSNGKSSTQQSPGLVNLFIFTDDYEYIS